jgi:hypothetical protein
MTALREGIGERGRPSPGRPRWRAWLPVLGVGIGLFIAVRQALVMTGNPILVPSGELRGVRRWPEPGL